MVMMGGIKVVNTPVDVTDDVVGTEGASQVILFNDDHNEAGYVVQCLMRVFGHNEHLAAKIMFEAHGKGRAIAEMEDGKKAQLHKEQLDSCGLTSAVEQI